MAFQNFFKQKLDVAIDDSQTTGIILDEVPTVTPGNLVISPRNPAKREIIHYTGTSGKTLTGVTRGYDGSTARTHSKNEPVEMNVIAADLDTTLVQDGDVTTAKLADGAVTTVKLADGAVTDDKLSAGVQDGWYTADETWDASYSGANLGGNFTKFKVSGDQTSKYTRGKRIKFPRASAPGTKALRLDGSTQRAERAHGSVSLPATNKVTIEAYVDLDTIQHANDRTILSWYSSSQSRGFGAEVNLDGSLQIFAYGTGGSSSVYSQASALPGDKTYAPMASLTQRWVHLAFVNDRTAGTGALYVNGIKIPHSITNTGGTDILYPTSTAKLMIGDRDAGGVTEFKGDIKYVRLWSTVRTQAQILDNMNKELVGNESGLIGYWDLENNYNDSTSNANHLTAIGSPTFEDSAPFNADEIGFVVDSTYSAPDTEVTVYSGGVYRIPPESITTGEISPVYAPSGVDLSAKNLEGLNHWHIDYPAYNYPWTPGDADEDAIPAMSLPFKLIKTSKIRGVVHGQVDHADIYGSTMRIRVYDSAGTLVTTPGSATWRLGVNNVGSAHAAIFSSNDLAAGDYTLVVTADANGSTAVSMNFWDLSLEMFADNIEDVA